MASELFDFKYDAYRKNSLKHSPHFMKKKIALFILSACCLFTVCFGQATKPNIMVMPSDNWCATNGFLIEVDNMGVTELRPDYEKALMMDNNMVFAISKIGQMMADRGFPLKDLSMTLKGVRNNAILDNVTESSQGGEKLAETPREALMRVANVDIVLYLSYHVNKTGPKSSLTYNMQGIDAYTFKQITASQGVGQQMLSTEFSVLLEKSIEEKMDGFVNQLAEHFNDLFTNGREVKLICQAWDSGLNFESEFGGEELGFLIEDWVIANTVNGTYTPAEASENRMVFDDARIPLVNERGTKTTTRLWANELRKWLKSKYNIDAKLISKGLGEAVLIVGSK